MKKAMLGVALVLLSLLFMANGYAEYNEETAAEALKLTVQAYLSHRDFSVLAQDGYYDYVPFHEGKLAEEQSGQADTSGSFFDSCTGFVSARNEMMNGQMKTVIYISFQGTQYLEDLLKDAFLARTSGDELHAGFAKHTNEFIEMKERDEIAFESLGGKTLKTIFGEMAAGSQNYHIVTTGHSLGGATASMLAQTLIAKVGLPANAVSCYTFASPKTNYTPSTTENPFVNPENYLIFNFVNDADIITHVGAHYRAGQDIPFEIPDYDGGRLWKTILNALALPSGVALNPAGAAAVLKSITTT